MSRLKTGDVPIVGRPLGFVDTLTGDGRILLAPASEPCWNGSPIPVLSRPASATEPSVIVGKLTHISVERSTRRILGRGRLFGQLPEAEPFIAAADSDQGLPAMLDLLPDHDASLFIPADRHEVNELPTITVFYRWQIGAVTVDPDGVPSWDGCAIREDRTL